MARVKPRSRSDVAVVGIDGEAVVYDVASRRLHYLNHSAALVFGLCDGHTTIAEMAEAIGEAYDMHPSEVDGQIRPLLSELRKLGLVEGKAADRLRQAAAEQSAPEQLRRIPVPRDT